eukprot:8318353-Alexandrium_andersonii.AAC.1
MWHVRRVACGFKLADHQITIWPCDCVACGATTWRVLCDGGVAVLVGRRASRRCQWSLKCDDGPIATQHVTRARSVLVVPQSSSYPPHVWR